MRSERRFRALAAIRLPTRCLLKFLRFCEHLSSQTHYLILYNFFTKSSRHPYAQRSHHLIASEGGFVSQQNGNRL